MSKNMLDIDFKNKIYKKFIKKLITFLIDISIIIELFKIIKNIVEFLFENFEYTKVFA